MTQSQNRPFKILYCDAKGREIFRIPAPALKLWLYHYSREGKEQKSFPSLDTLCSDLDMNKDTVLKWRKWLLTHAWLEKVGERQGNGMYGVPIVKARKGTVPERISNGRS